MIELYKEKRGFYPPDNILNPDLPPLYYELTSQPIPPALQLPAKLLGITNIINVASSNHPQDGEDARNFYPNVRTTQICTNDNGIQFLATQAKSTNGLSWVIWRYDSHSDNRHNHESFDLWADISINGKVITIGNWRD
jgi:hypothetical protein